MHIHRLNCATFCPIGRRLVNGEGRLTEEGRLICLCLLIESNHGLVLIDTGLGTQDIARARDWYRGTLWSALMRPKLDPAETAAAQLRALGHRPEDVRTIVLTHLDFDHAGGLADFPHADVHVSRPEYDAANSGPRLVKQRRYIPGQWSHRPHWNFHPMQGEPWFGFQAVRPVAGLDPEILLIPIPGHSQGHCAVAVRTSPGAAGSDPTIPDGWVLHCGDAYFHHAEIDPTGATTPPPGVKAYQQIYQARRTLRIQNQARLRALARTHGAQIRMICSHDPFYLDAATKDSEAPSPADAAMGGRLAALDRASRGGATPAR